MKKMLAVCAALVLSAQVFAQEQSEDGKFGVRAFGNATNFVDGIKSPSNTTFGPGFGIGTVRLIPFSGIYLATEVLLEHRTVNSEEYGYDVTYKEWDIRANFNFRFRYAPENIVYLEIGPAFALVFDPEVIVEGIDEELFDDDDFRSAFDIGLNWGIGFRIGDHHSLDYKVFRSFTDYGDDVSFSLVTSQIGYTYMF